MRLRVKERILSIRLMEKVNANPVYAKAFGLAVVNGFAGPKRQTALHSPCDKP